MSEINPSNKCAQLYDPEAAQQHSGDRLKAIFEMQTSLQKRVGSDPNTMSFQERIQFLMNNWNFLSCEYAEMLERTPFKSWKSYTPEQKAGFLDEEHKLEVWYEWCDMFHFFINMGLCLGIDADAAFTLYHSKNKENFARQDRGY